MNLRRVTNLELIQEKIPTIFWTDWRITSVAIEPCPFEIEIAVEKLKRSTSPGIDHTLAELIN